jgi:hypothetical protein
MGLPPHPNWKCRKCQTVGDHYTPDCPNQQQANTNNGQGTGNLQQATPNQGPPAGNPGNQGNGHLPLNRYDPQLVSILQGQAEQAVQGHAGQQNYPYNAPIEGRGQWGRAAEAATQPGGPKLC